MSSWKITIEAPREVVEAALLAHEDAHGWDSQIALSGTRVDEAASELWKLEAWLPRKPSKADQKAIAALFTSDLPELQIERLEERDWVAESQRGLEPIRAGRFIVHTPEDPPALADTGAHRLEIPASRAFGTGHHETTAGCLAMLSRMRASGTAARNVADIGTGTGVLALAVLKLWPRAIVTASDIDPVSASVAMDNAERNAIPLGSRGGELTITIADGMAHPLIDARGPYDLVIANILAGPLIAMAPDFARALIPGGSLLLAGLMGEQETLVRAACRRAGFRLAARIIDGDWPVLWMRKRPGARRPRQRRAANSRTDGW